MDQLKRGLARRSMAEGFLTLELLIAFAIVLLVLSGIIITSFSNQSTLLSTTTTNEALKLAQALLEEKQAQGRQDFYSVNPHSPTLDDIYTKSVYVDVLKDEDGGITDHLTKQVRATVTWPGEWGKTHHVELVTLISDFDTPVGGDTCNSVLTNQWDEEAGEWIHGWDDPQVVETFDFSDIDDDDNTDKYELTDIDAYKGYLYITAGKATDEDGSVSIPTFFVFEIEDDDELELEDTADNSPIVTTGMNAVRVAENVDSGNTYAFTASNTYVPGDCDPGLASNCAQIYIFDVTDTGDISREAYLKLLNLTSGNQIDAHSIYFRNNYIYLGLNANAEEEFYIIDVHHPDEMEGVNHLVNPLGKFEVGNKVNTILPAGAYAYVGSGNSEELKVLDISNPLAITQAESFNGPGTGVGNSLALVADQLYFGKSRSNYGEEFHILDAEDPDSLDLENSVEIDESIDKIIIRDYLAFILTDLILPDPSYSGSAYFKVFDISDLDDIEEIGSLSLPDDGGDEKPSMDCEGDRFYITTNNGSDQGHIHIIAPNI